MAASPDTPRPPQTDHLRFDVLQRSVASRTPEASEEAPAGAVPPPHFAPQQRSGHRELHAQPWDDTRTA